MQSLNNIKQHYCIFAHVEHIGVQIANSTKGGRVMGPRLLHVPLVPASGLSQLIDDGLIHSAASC